MGLRIAVFGQAAFGRAVTGGVERAGHAIVGVYAPPDRGRPDPLAQLAAIGGRLSVGKLRVGTGEKMSAAECGLVAGARLR